VAAAFPLFTAASELDPDDPRAGFDAFTAALNYDEPPEVPVREDAAPGPHGSVRVRVYSPADDAADRPCLVWMHGGGFVAGDLDMPEADRVARELVVRAGAVVVSVDYRLAVGGVRYPVPHDDVVAAVRWARRSADTLGIDPGRIAVGGASAGGNLAAGAVLRMRDEDRWLPTILLLAYSAVHAVVPAPTPALAAMMQHVPRAMRFLPSDRDEMTRNYLGGAPSRADGYAMPAGAVLDGLGPVLLVNAEYDDLRPSSEAFAAALALAGVDVQQVTVKTVLHGFLNTSPRIEPVGRALDLMARALANAGAIFMPAARHNPGAP
jgi:acetyl esterase/lipase